MIFLKLIYSSKFWFYMIFLVDLELELLVIDMIFDLICRSKFWFLIRVLT